MVGLNKVHEVPEIVVIADGAPWIWQQVSACLPFTNVEIVDFYHAAEQLATTARTLFDEGTDKAKSWLNEHRHILRHEGVEALLKKLRNSRRYRNKHGTYHRNYRFYYTDYRGRRRQGTGTPNRKQTNQIAEATQARHKMIRAGIVPPPASWDLPRNFAQVTQEYLRWGEKQGGKQRTGWSASHKKQRET